MMKNFHKSTQTLSDSESITFVIIISTSETGTLISNFAMIIFYTETPEKQRASTTSFEFSAIKLVAKSALYWGASVCRNIENN